MQFRTSIADLTNCHKTSVWSLWRRKSIFSSFNASRYCLDLVHFVSPSYAIRRSHTQKIAEKSLSNLQFCLMLFYIGSINPHYIQPSEYNGVGELTLIYSPSQQWLYIFLYNRCIPNFRISNQKVSKILHILYQPIRV